MKTTKAAFVAFKLKCQLRQFGLVVARLISAFLLSGCVSPVKVLLYENLEHGISLEHPDNWELTFVERNGTIYLKPNDGIQVSESTLIQVGGSACSPVVPNNDDPTEYLRNDIVRIGYFYAPDSVQIIQEPHIIEDGDYQIASATITVPTMSLGEGSISNQMGLVSPDVFQTITSYYIGYRNASYIVAHVYEGASEELNAVAHEIIGSIRITCSAEP